MDIGNESRTTSFSIASQVVDVGDARAANGSPVRGSRVVEWSIARSE